MLVNEQEILYYAVAFLSIGQIVNYGKKSDARVSKLVIRGNILYNKIGNISRRKRIDLSKM